jgi:hypothetical protein
MSERISAYIEIAGALTARTRDALAEVILAEGAGPEWGDHFSNIAEVLDAIAEAAAANIALMLYDDQANYGCFEDLEQFCKDEKLPFRRTCDARYEYNGEIVYFDGTFIIEMDGDQHGEITMSLSDVKKAVESGELEATLARYEATLTLPALSLVP